MPGDYLNWRTSWCAVSNWRQTCLGMTFGRLLILMREKKSLETVSGAVFHIIIKIKCNHIDSNRIFTTNLHLPKFLPHPGSNQCHICSTLHKPCERGARNKEMILKLRAFIRINEDDTYRKNIHKSVDKTFWPLRVFHESRETL